MNKITKYYYYYYYYYINAVCFVLNKSQYTLLEVLLKTL